jgi:hypothetical protein
VSRGTRLPAPAPAPPAPLAPRRPEERLFGGVLMGSLLLTAAGWLADKLGWLPPALEGYAWVTATLGVAAAVLLGSVPIVREHSGPGPLRATRITLVLLATAFAIGEAAVFLVDWEPAALANVLMAGGALLGGALLSDGVRAWQRGTLPPLGVAGAIAGGIGTLLLAADHAFAALAAYRTALVPAALALVAFCGFALLKARAYDRAVPVGGTATEPVAPVATPLPEAFPRSFPRRRPS